MYKYLRHRSATWVWRTDFEAGKSDCRSQGCNPMSAGCASLNVVIIVIVVIVIIIINIIVSQSPYYNLMLGDCANLLWHICMSG